MKIPMRGTVEQKWQCDVLTSVVVISSSGRLTLLLRSICAECRSSLAGCQLSIVPNIRPLSNLIGQLRIAGASVIRDEARERHAVLRPSSPFCVHKTCQCSSRRRI